MATTISADEIRRVKGLGFLHNKGTDTFSARVLTVNGKVTPKQLACVAEAAAAYASGDVTFTSRQTMEVQGVSLEHMEAFRAHLAQAGLEIGGTGPRVRPVVCCKGTTCQYGNIDTFALAEKIHQRFYTGYHGVQLPHKFKIAVGGCPNNCVKPDLNDLGVIGQCVPAYASAVCVGCGTCAVEKVCPMGAAKRVGDKMQIDEASCINCGRCVGRCPFDAVPTRTVGYRIFLGGYWGKRGRRGIPLPVIFTNAEDVLATVEKAILMYREQGKPGERFGLMIARLGFDTVAREVLADAILARKSSIIGA